MGDMKYPEHNEIRIVDLSTDSFIEAGWQIMDVVAVQRVEYHQEEIPDPSKINSCGINTIQVCKPFHVSTNYAICGRTSDARAEIAESRVLDLEAKIRELEQAKEAAEGGRKAEEERYSKLKQSHSEITSLRDEDMARISGQKTELHTLKNNMEKLELAIGTLKMQEVIGA